MYDKQTIPQRINRNLPDGQGLRKGVLGKVTMNFRMEMSKMSVEMAANLCIQKCRQGSDGKMS